MKSVSIEFGCHEVDDGQPCIRLYICVGDETVGILWFNKNGTATFKRKTQDGTLPPYPLFGTQRAAMDECAKHVLLVCENEGLP